MMRVHFRSHTPSGSGPVIIRAGKIVRASDHPPAICDDSATAAATDISSAIRPGYFKARPRGRVSVDLIGRHSVTEVLEPEMSDEEREGLRKSADTTGKRW